MKKRFLYLILPIITLILEVLPYGAVLNFGNPEGDPWRETFSYFDLTPFGYANFSPFITAALTCAILVILIIYCITSSLKAAEIVRVLLCICSVLSLCPLVFGISCFSVIGVLITVSLITELIIVHLHIKKDIEKH